MTRYLLTIVSLVGIYTSAMAQVPTPQAIQASHTGPGHVVGIRGVGFGTDKTKLVVYFGGAKGIVANATDQLVEALIPTGATFDNISVTNTNSKLTGYTPQNFLMSFGGDFGFDPNNLGPQQDFPTEPGLFDQCLCDFNGDGLVDVVTASQTNATAAIFTNTSTPGAINFTKNVMTITGKPFHAKCGDLNGDGMPDLVMSEAGNGERIFVLQNTSAGSISFSPTIIVLTQTLKKPKQIQIADLDGDGKPEIIATDLKQTNGTGNVNIFINQSSGGTLAFSSAPITMGVAGTTSTDGLAIKDLNDDGKPEIITSKYADTQSNIFVAGNKSTPGNISFDAFATFAINGGVSIIKVGDLDADGKPDLAMSLFLNGVVAVMRNTSSGSTFSFDTPVNIPANAAPNGLDIGDIDGDGKPDLIAASISSKTVTFLNNVSSPGSFSFQLQTKNTTEINRHINVGDLDGDGKPDVVFTSTTTSKLSVFRNKTCMIPKIVPEGPWTICSGTTKRLNVTVSLGTTYDWKLDGNPLTSTTNAFYDVLSQQGSFTVVAKAESGACVKTSNAVSISVSGTGTGTVTIPAVPQVCKGSLATIAATDPGTGLTFKWTGPNNYTATGATATVPNFQAFNAGRYSLDVYVGSGPGACLYQQLSTVVEISDVDNSFAINFSNGPQICQGNTKSLTYTPRAGFAYEWWKDNNPTGVTTTPYNAGAGKYVVKATPLGCTPVETPPVFITELTLPDASFTNPAKACQGELVQFTNTSSVDPTATPVYTWTFGDTQNSNDAQPTHQYATAGSPTITLKVEYAGCSDTKLDGSITISAAPAIQIVNPEASGVFKFCDGDSLKLTVPGVFTGYTWSNGGSSADVYVKTSGIVSVTATTPDGCHLFDDQAITVDPAPQIEVTATPPQINEGESAQLQASAGLKDYNWTPDDGTLSAINTASPTAAPLVTTTYFVSANSGGGCPGRGSIDVVVRGEPIVNKLTPGKFFSPNGDDKNATWLVKRIEEFSQCGVSIYDDKGVKVFESKPYANDWDGTFKGKKLPDGVYYYIIRCDGEEGHPRTGSITVLR